MTHHSTHSARSSTVAVSGHASDPDTINLYDLTSTLVNQWVLILASGMVGLLIGAAAWWVTGEEAELKAKIVVTAINFNDWEKTFVANTSIDRPLDFFEWRNIASGFPALAESRQKNVSNDPDKRSLYATLSNASWWAKNVKPQYRYSKTDLQQLGALLKSVQDSGASTAIEFIQFRAQSRHPEQAVALVRGTREFAREGGLLLALRSTLESQELGVRQATMMFKRSISETELELTYLYQRAQALENLLKKYPSHAIVSSQNIIDPKDSSSKYLPLGTQLMAVRIDIQTKEALLKRYQESLDGAAVAQHFIEQSLPLTQNDPNGFELAEKIGAIETKIRKTIDPTNKGQVAIIDQIRFELDKSVARFNSLFESQESISTQRSVSGLILAVGAFCGLLVGAVLALLFAAWQKHKRARGMAVAQS